MLLLFGAMCFSCKSGISPDDDRSVSSYEDPSGASSAQIPKDESSANTDSEIVTPSNITGAYLACTENFDESRPNDLMCRVERQGSIVKLEPNIRKSKSWRLMQQTLELEGEIQVEELTYSLDWDVQFRVDSTKEVDTYADILGVSVAIEILLETGWILMESELSDALSAKDGQILPENRTRVEKNRY